MKLHQWLRVALISGSIMALGACSSAHKNGDTSAVDQANAAYEQQAQASGLGEESGMYSDQAGEGIHKRVYYFDYDSNVVHGEDMPAIANHAHFLRNHPEARIILEGHTDPRGSREYNIGLGERRAKAVAEILTSKGVSRSQIRIVSYGAEKLAAPGRSESDFQRDRRVVLAHIRS